MFILLLWTKSCCLRFHLVNNSVSRETSMLAANRLTQIGYQTHCNHCDRYSDIWVNGLRVQCGDWSSGDYESDYGVLTKAQKREQRKALWKLNFHLCLERAAWQFKHWQQNHTLHTPVQKQVHSL